MSHFVVLAMQNIKMTGNDISSFLASTISYYCSTVSGYDLLPCSLGLGGTYRIIQRQGPQLSSTIRDRWSPIRPDLEESKNLIMMMIIRAAD